METVVNVQNVVDRALAIRQHIIRMLLEAGSGHSAGALGMADLMAALYFGEMKHNPADPDWKDRDIFFLSNGHTAPVLYATLAECGYFPVDELATLRKFGSRLQGHPERRLLPGLESTSGPLGSGLSQGAGYAYVMKYISKQPDRFVFTMLGDGELNEGNIWEAAMFASKYGLNQLIGIVDRNNIQIDGTTEEVMPLEDLAAKWRAFGWHVLEIDGHDVPAILDAFENAKAEADRPTMIIARTIPGKGVDFMENDHHWHGKPPSPEQAAVALDQLSQIGESQ